MARGEFEEQRHRALCSLCAVGSSSTLSKVCYSMGLYCSTRSVLLPVGSVVVVSHEKLSVFVFLSELFFHRFEVCSVDEYGEICEVYIHVARLLSITSNRSTESSDKSGQLSFMNSE